MASRIITKKGSGAPLASDLVHGELAVDTVNKRLYTENAGGTVIEVGINPTSITTGTITADSATIQGATVSSVSIQAGDTTSSAFVYFGDSDAAFRGGLEFKNTDESLNFYAGGLSTPDMTISTAGNVDIAGTITADALTVDAGGTLRLDASSTTDFFTIAQGGTQAVLTADSPDGAGNMIFRTASAGVDADRVQIASNGDISFYSSDGLSQALFWDASAESLGLGTTSPARLLHLESAAPAIRIKDTSGTGTIHELITSGADGNILNLLLDAGGAGTSPAFIIKNVGTELMRLDDSGRVGIGTSSPAAKLEIGGAGEGIILASPDGTRYEITVANGGTLTVTAV